MQALRAALMSAGKPVGADELAQGFKGARGSSVKEMLAAMAVLGQARLVEQGRYAA
jgi:hypothetical protein